MRFVPFVNILSLHEIAQLHCLPFPTCERYFVSSVHKCAIQSISLVKIFILYFYNPLWNNLQGLACLGKVPLLVGILISDFEKAFRMIDVGPSADNKIEVFIYVLKGYFFCLISVFIENTYMISSV
jgi:hypothetical protein